jgi:hypothetical protein
MRFKLALQLATVVVLAEKIKIQQRNLAAPAIRTNAQGLPRMGAVMVLSRPVDDIWNLEQSTNKRRGSMNLYRTKLKVCATCIFLSYPLQALS